MSSIVSSNVPSPLEPHAHVAKDKTTKISRGKTKTKTEKSIPFPAASSKEQSVTTRSAKNAGAARKETSSPTSKVGGQVLETVVKNAEGVPEVKELTAYLAQQKKGKRTLTLKSLFELRERLVSKIENQYQSYDEVFKAKLNEQLLTLDIQINSNFPLHMLSKNNPSKGRSNVRLDESMKQLLKSFSTPEVKKYAPKKETCTVFIKETINLQYAIHRLITVMYASVLNKKENIEASPKDPAPFQPVMKIHTTETPDHVMITIEGNGVPFELETAKDLAGFEMDHIIKNIYGGTYSVKNLKDRRQIVIVLPKDALPKPLKRPPDTRVD